MREPIPATSRHTCHPFHATGGDIASCPACQTGDTYEGWRARAEALAEVIEETLIFAETLAGWDDVDRSAARKVRAVIARLPAQALAERRALERCADVLRAFGPWKGEVGAAALAALDVARGEGGA